MSYPPTLQAVIESVEALSEDEQDILFDLIYKRRIAKRRQEIAQNAMATMQAVRNGTAQRSTATELMANIFGVQIGNKMPTIEYLRSRSVSSNVGTSSLFDPSENRSECYPDLHHF